MSENITRKNTILSDAEKNLALHQELKNKVHQILREKNISFHGGRTLYLKAIFIFLAWSINYGAWLYTGKIHATLFCLLLSLSLGLFTVVIECNLTHEGSHQCFSSSKFMNYFTHQS